MTIKDSGNVGIGTTSPSTNLQVTKASSGASGVISATTVSLFENSGNTDIVIGAGNTSNQELVLEIMETLLMVVLIMTIQIGL